ncbi:hypothetical protein [Miltoncostaea oceani]|jgi:hypothetical protein|uniref:hypothetical protein n=1 Tax=Miltoncostaea oceani TaxID=2843216 RepID=UPI001C3C92AF|nr:hypothetical protein [Miltoncostaea oceani]
MTVRRLVASLATGAAVLAILGCGGGDEPAADAPRSTATSASQARFEKLVREASTAAPADFPKARGRTLQQIADLVDPGPQVGLATSVYLPGRNRFAFGVIAADNRLVFSPSAVYIAETAASPARGPFVATLDPLLVDPAYRGADSAAENDVFAAIYTTEVMLPRARTYEILVVTRVDGRLYGAPTIVEAKTATSVPDVGAPAPDVATDTLSSAGGDLASVETREPTDGMHDVSLSDVIGERPVALLFSTPALCESRVCGPVLDLAVQLEATYGDRVEFIHQEVFVDNRPDRGFRPSLRAFGLPTEPWLFTFDADGRVAARLEGSFGVGEFEQALEAALR